jgi:hypothetical protein
MYFSFSFKNGRRARCGHVGKRKNICAAKELKLQLLTKETSFSQYRQK